MKLIIGALALAFAYPAAAQTAPAAQHQDHGTADHRQHGQTPAEHGQHQPGQHEGHGDGCCADRNNNGRMDCCEDLAESQDCCCYEHGSGHGEQGSHQGH